MIINGKEIAKKINQKTAQRIKKINKIGYHPEIAVVLVGQRKESVIYVRQKEILAKKLGFNFYLINLPTNISQNEVVKEINKIQRRPQLCGLILQLPLPKHLDPDALLREIRPEYDIDVLSEINLGKIFLNSCFLEPPTAGAIMEIIKSFNINLAGKKILLIGAGLLVGRPLMMILMNKRATVVSTNSSTKDLSSYCREADIIITGAGVKNLIKPNMVNTGAIVIDAGFLCDKSGKVFGDADVAGLDKKKIWITPTPGGVGPITVAKLMQNAILCAEFKLKNKQ